MTRGQWLCVYVVTAGLIAMVTSGCVFAAPGRPWWRRAHLHTSIAFDYFSADRNLDGKKNFVGATARWGLRPLLGHRLHGVFSGWFTDPGLNHEDEPQLLVREGFLEQNWHDNELRVGRQIVLWGNGEGVNPMSTLTPRNYTILQTGLSDEEMGISSVVWNHFVGSHYSFTSFVSPFFEPSVIPLPQFPGVGFQSNAPATTMAHTEFGFKASRTSGSGDWSVSLYHGFHLKPNLQIVNAAAAVVGLMYNPITVVGADFDRPVGSRFVVWGQAAFVKPDGVNEQLPTTQKPSVYGVLGVSRTWEGGLSTALQFVERSVESYVAPQSAAAGPEREIAIENALINGEWHRNNYGVTFQCLDSWRNQTLQGKLFVYVNTRPINTYVRATLGYAETDHVVESIGAEDYNGPVNSEFGQLKTDSTVFVQWRYNMV